MRFLACFTPSALDSICQVLAVDVAYGKVNLHVKIVEKVFSLNLYFFQPHFCLFGT